MKAALAVGFVLAVWSFGAFLSMLAGFL